MLLVYSFASFSLVEVSKPLKYFSPDVSDYLSICFSVRQWLLEAGRWLLGSRAHIIQAWDSDHRSSIRLLEAWGGKPSCSSNRRLRWLLEARGERAIHSNAWRLRRLLETRWEGTIRSCDWQLWQLLARGGPDAPCPWGWWEGGDRWQRLLGRHMYVWLISSLYVHSGSMWGDSLSTQITPDETITMPLLLQGSLGFITAAKKKIWGQTEPVFDQNWALKLDFDWDILQLISTGRPANVSNHHRVNVEAEKTESSLKKTLWINFRVS